MERIRRRSQQKRSMPVVMVLAGHDPTGGAGIQADIEAIRHQGAWPATLITCLTQQDTHNVTRLWPQSADALLAQGASLIEDMAPDAVKIGLIGDEALVPVIIDLLAQLPAQTPVVLDPILAAGGGKNMGSEALLEAIRQQLVPKSTVITPNIPELAKLSPGQPHEAAQSQHLLSRGCQAVLATGTHSDTPGVKNILYQAHEPPIVYRWPRLPHEYHGSGCTLSAALTARLAAGDDLHTACTTAQDYTWLALEQGLMLGKGQHLPLRHGERS